VDYLAGFDFSAGNKALVSYGADADFRQEGGILTFRIGNSVAKFPLLREGLNKALPCVQMKVILTLHSTLVFGALGYYDGNIMTYMRPANLKLAQRCIYYLRQ
jgi:hypothetical protein